MSKLLPLLFLALFFTSCNQDDDACLSFAPPEFFIELLDSEGNNLIENGTFIGPEITVLTQNVLMSGVVFPGLEEVENLIVIELLGLDGDNEYQINLSDSVTDILILNLSVENHECGPVKTVNTATYNGVSQTVETYIGRPIIRVVR